MITLLPQVRPTPLKRFVAKAFAFFNLDWREHVQQNHEFFRPTDLLVSRANPTKG